MFKKKPTPPPAGRRRQSISTTAPRAGTTVFSYHASRSARPANTGRGEASQQTSTAVLRRSKRINWFKRGPIAVGVVAVTLIFLANSVVSTTPKILVPAGQSGQIFLRSQGAYEQAAHAALASSIMNRNKITINTSAIARSLQAQFPELAAVSVTLPLAGTRPLVYLQPTMPRLLLTSTDGKTYVIDDAGRALILANQVQRIAKLGLPTVIDQSGLSMVLGKATLPSTSVAAITEVTGQLKAKNVPFTSLTLPPQSSELDVRIGNVPYFVKFNLRGDARAETGTYLAVTAQLSREHKTPSTYIDVRVDQRAYYK